MKRGRNTDRPNGVSLFRAGHPRLETSISLDQRTGREIFQTPTGFAEPHPSRIWTGIAEIISNPAAMAANGLFPKLDPEGPASIFDLLRTKILQAMTQKGWRRLAVSSPRAGCGKSFVATNLALALARLPSCRTLLIDLDLRSPGLAALLGQHDAPHLLDFLHGDAALETVFRRLGPNLMLGLNGTAIPNATETLQEPEAAKALLALQEILQPDLLIFDTPPVLGSDEVISLGDKVDAMLLVTDGTKTAPQDILAAEQMLEGRIPLLAVVLNRAQDPALYRKTSARV